MGHIEREGRAAEHDQRPLDRIAHPISKRAQNGRRPERHQHEEQAGWVFRHVQKIDERADRTVLNLPGVGLAVDADPLSTTNAAIAATPQASSRASRLCAGS